jgi:hypothetical protein
MRRSGATAAASIERFLGIARLVLAAGGAVAAAVCGWWDAPTLALTAVALVWGGARLFGLGRNPPRAAVAIFALAWCGFSLFLAWNGPQGLLWAVVPLLYFLVAAGLLVRSAGRSGFPVVSLCFAALLVAALGSPGPGFFLAIACFVPCAVAALAASEIAGSLAGAAAPAAAPRLAPRVAVFAAFAAAAILLMAGGLFFLLPRTADAARRWQAAHAARLEGFSTRIALREIGELKTSSRPIMRVTVFSPLPVAGLKWRGGLLTTFDGKEWTNPEPALRLIRLRSSSRGSRRVSICAISPCCADRAACRASSAVRRGRFATRRTAAWKRRRNNLPRPIPRRGWTRPKPRTTCSCLPRSIGAFGNWRAGGLPAPLAIWPAPARSKPTCAPATVTRSSCRPSEPRTRSPISFSFAAAAIASISLRR